MLSFYIMFWTDSLIDIETDRRIPLKQFTSDRSMLGHKKKKMLVIGIHFFSKNVSNSSRKKFYHSWSLIHLLLAKLMLSIYTNPKFCYQVTS